MAVDQSSIKETTSPSVNRNGVNSDLVEMSSVPVAAVPAVSMGSSSPIKKASSEPQQTGEFTYLDFLRKVQNKWTDCPDLTVSLHNLAYNVPVPIKVQSDCPNFIRVGVNQVGSFIRDQLNLGGGRKFENFPVLAPITGVIKPGTMTLVLAPPGAGKTAFLKALAGLSHSNKRITGKVLYNGKTYEENLANGVHVAKLCSFMSQTDVHFPVLTVKETMQFATESAVAKIDLLGDAELVELEKKRAELLIKMLGLEECSDTICGSDMLRGVSGGQRRRVTIGEMLITNSRLYCCDEISTGLDAAVTYHIFEAMKNITRINRSSVVTALLQPTPETYGLFDDVILMKDGEVIFHGARENVKPFMRHFAGVDIPDELDEAGFLVDFLTDPLAAVRHLHRMHMMRAGKSAAISPNEIVMNPVLAREANREAVEDVVHQEGEREHSVSSNEVNFHYEEKSEKISLHKAKLAESGYLPSSSVVPASPSGSSRPQELKKPSKPVIPALTTKELVNRFHQSPFYQQQTQEASLCAETKDFLEPSKWSHYTKNQFGRSYAHSYGHHTALDIVRQRKLTFRNKQIVVPRLIQAVLMGFIYGTLFIKLGFGDYSSKFGLLMYSIMYGAFANLSELPMASEARNVVTKQLDAGFFPTIPFILSNVWWSVPRIALECLIFGSFLYWIPDFVPEAGRYFFFLFIIFLGSMSMSTFFRTVSFVASNPDVARQLDFPFIVIYVIFAGFLIPYNKIPKWLIWLYWLNPLQWAVKSLSLNEFNSSRYDALNSEGLRYGHVYMSAFGISSEEIYKWMGVIYLFGFFAIFVFISALALSTVRQSGSLGTKRLPTGEAGHIQKELSKNNGQLIHQQSTNTRLVKDLHLQMMGQSSKGVNLGTLPFSPVTLAWRNIKYTVYVGKEKKPKVLLKSISGYARPGTLTALMGASGAGKTTLMDVIAGRKTMGTIEGDILVNGRLKEPISFNHLTGYVEQQDLHMGLHTVKEALNFSAKIRLPASVTEQQRQEFINEVMGLVGLTRIQNRLIGDAAVPGLSPGQLKLLTIGVELVANPSVLFLDEPTSGLDAPSAFRVMKAVRRIAETGRSVICTIHQPSQELFFMFDRLLLLRSGGEDVYFADIGENASQLVHYFETIAGPDSSKLPFGINPANWMLNVTSAGMHTEEGGSIQLEGYKAADYVALWKSSDLGAQTQREVEENSASSPELEALVDAAKNQKYVSWGVRFEEVMKRYFVMHWRNAPTNLTRVILLTLMGLLLGLIYLKISTSDFAGIQSAMSCIFLGLSFAASVSANSALPSFFRQRAVYYRETTVGMYDFIHYSMGVTAVEIPFIFFSMFFFVILFYFMVGLVHSGELFFRYYMVVFMMGIVYSFLSQLWMALCPTQVVSNVVNGFFMSLFFMFAGVFIRPDAIPRGWKWFYYIDPMPKALIAATMPQFYCDTDGLDPSNPAQASACPTVLIPNDDGSGSTTYFTYDYVVSALNGGVHDYGPMLGWLVLTLVVIRVLNLFCLRFISHLKR